MKILVTGYNGQLGFDVVRQLEKQSIECTGVGTKDFDITNFENMQSFISKNHPSAIIHCAAYTAVDLAEDFPEECYKVNVEGTKNLVSICKKLDIPLLYVSTDYVFNGEGDEEHEEDEKTAPPNVYGKSKLLGEQEVLTLPKYFIVRTSWVYGKNGKNFVKTMQELAKTKDSLSIISDQIGSPTYTVDLAKLLCAIIQSKKYGVYHATNEGFCSWAEFASEILPTKKINFIQTKDYPTKAKRPQNSRLSKKSLDMAGFDRLPHWKDALVRYMEEK
ncbi:MAG: dTDP-4-dehydrorhamnose reductase [Treponemataceae bacterium]